MRGRTGAGRVASARRFAAALAAAIVALSPAAPGALSPEEVFTIAPVSVDVTAASALAARETALARGQAEAWRRLLDRLTLPGDAASLAGYGADRVAALLEGYEILRERASDVRYLAELSFGFDPGAVRGLLSREGIAFAETPSRPLLVVPVFSRDGADLLWEDANPWLEAWRDRPPDDGLAPVVAPHGDLADMRDLSTAQALAGDAARLGALAARYGAGEAAVARAVWRAGTPGRPPALEIAILRPGESADGSVALETALAAGSDPAGALAEGAARAAAALAGAWKRANLARPGADSRLSVVVPIDGFGRWLSIRERLAGIGILRRVEPRRLSRREAALELWVQGGADQLRNALRQRGLVLREGAEGLVLADADQAVPPRYFPSEEEEEAPPPSPAGPSSGSGA